MAILKHISVKNRFYSDAVEYLTCQFDEYTNKPILDEKGRIMERENYLIDGVNCDVDTFGAECIQTNRFYGKNNSVEDVKAHHYIISFSPGDPITMEQALEFGKNWLKEFAPGHQAVVAVHLRICTFTWLSIPCGNSLAGKAYGTINHASGSRAVSIKVLVR